MAIAEAFRVKGTSARRGVGDGFAERQFLTGKFKVAGKG